MSYYPFIKAPGCKSWVTLCNFAPNNWEFRKKNNKYINLTWSDGAVWQSRQIESIEDNGVRTITEDNISSVVPDEALALLSITDNKLPQQSKHLPVIKSPTVMPAWRASLGLSTENASTNYQGEIDPFPSPGTLLTFCPFLQFNESVENFLVLLNLEKSPVTRIAKVELYDADKKILKGKFEVKNNSATVIKLDNLKFEKNDLVLTICREMCAIPVYFSKTVDGSYLSLEHTHPPASFVIHGNRWGVQKLIKNLWFSKTLK